nr:family 1 glycosylhydrolase [Candidatus Cyanaurora vandensis]
MLTRHDFPADFAWGAATTSYQIEGATQTDGRGPSIWDTFAHRPGKINQGETGDVACEHYHPWRADCQLIKELGLSHYHFSISGSRVLPTGTGAVNRAGLDFFITYACDKTHNSKYLISIYLLH